MAYICDMFSPWCLTYGVDWKWVLCPLICHHTIKALPKIPWQPKYNFFHNGHEPIILVVSNAYLVVTYLFEISYKKTHLFLQIAPFFNWFEHLIFITCIIVILFHFLTIVSNLSNMFRFVMCSSFMALTNVRISPCSISGFSWLKFGCYNLFVWLRTTFLPFPFFLVGATNSSIRYELVLKNYRLWDNLGMPIITKDSWNQ
jgi:hypothetical protein